MSLENHFDDCTGCLACVDCCSFHEFPQTVFVDISGVDNGVEALSGFPYPACTVCDNMNGLFVLDCHENSFPDNQRLCIETSDFPQLWGVGCTRAYDSDTSQPCEWLISLKYGRKLDGFTYFLNVTIENFISTSLSKDYLDLGIESNKPIELPVTLDWADKLWYRRTTCGRTANIEASCDYSQISITISET